MAGASSEPGHVGATARSGPPSSGLTVNVSGEGIVTYSDGSPPCSTDGCTTNESPHRVVFLTAIPAQGYHFKGWTKGCVGAGAICGVTPAQAPIVSAQFVHAGWFQLTVSGPGLVSSDDGMIACGMGQSNCSDPLSGTGTTRFTATTASGAVFLGWGGACAQFATGPCVADNSAFTGATAAFASTSLASTPEPITVRHMVSVASAPNVLDACLATNPCATSVSGGSYFTLIAGGSFISSPFSRPFGLSWRGGCVGTWPVCSLRVDGPTEVAISISSDLVTPASAPAHATVTLPVTVIGRGILRAVRGRLTPPGCGSRPEGGGYACTLAESGGAFDLRARPVGHNKFNGWDSSQYTLCRHRKRPECSARVSYQGPALAANFSGR